MQVTYKAHALDISSCSVDPHATRMPVMVQDDSLKPYMDRGWVQVGKATITVDYATPEEVDAQRLEALNAELKATLARHEVEKSALLDRISNLTAIGYTEAA